MSFSLIARRFAKPISNTVAKAVYSRSIVDAQQAFFDQQKKEMGMFAQCGVTYRCGIHREDSRLDGKKGLRENGLR